MTGKGGLGRAKEVVVVETVEVEVDEDVEVDATGSTPLLSATGARGAPQAQPTSDIPRTTDSRQRRSFDILLER
ncbi:MAG: hypothetical protein JO337_03085 [Acidimicrobiales bacterium]|nr:hypothetical protein [Acidimicrobiales bacterium]